MTFKTIGDLINLPNGGVGESVVANWIDRFRAIQGNEERLDFDLTALQAKAAANTEAFVERGSNLMVVGPTSSGKTLVAEMLIANVLARGAAPFGCIYAVPLRALASEKLERFQKIFGEKRVYVSSSDYQEFDIPILQSRFRIAVVVYEKLYSWLANEQTASRLLRNSTLLIVDEIQMLTEPQRGAKLEMILTFMRDYQSRQLSRGANRHRYRIVGLGPNEIALAPVAKWLGAEMISVPDSERPVPLVEGFLTTAGQLHLETLPEQLKDSTLDGQLALPVITGSSAKDLTQKFIVKTLSGTDGRRVRVGGGKRILVYSPSQDEAERMAKEIAQALGQRQELDESTLNTLDTLEATGTLILLREMLESGVGFHHGDLGLEERMLVESLFNNMAPNRTALDVVVSTPTLAMGVNLPADYMLFSSSDTYRRNEGMIKGVQIQKLSPLEYKNFAGRAGRYRPNLPKDYYGLALFLTNLSESEAKVELVRGLIQADIPPLEPALRRWPYGLEPLALAALAWKGVYTESQNLTPDRMKVFFADTLTGTTEKESLAKDLKTSIQDEIVNTLSATAKSHKELVGNRNDSFQLKSTGQVVATSGIDLSTYVVLKRISEKLPAILSQPFVLLEELVQAREIANQYPVRIVQGAHRTIWTYHLQDFLRKMQEEQYELGTIAKEMLAATYNQDNDSIACMMRVIATWYWMQGASGEQLTGNPLLPDLRYGAVLSLTDQLSWLLGGLGAIWEMLGYQDIVKSMTFDSDAARKEWADEIKWSITRFERRIRYGVKEELTSVANLRIRGWNRQRLAALWEALAGWKHPVYLLDYSLAHPPKQLRPFFRELKEKIRKRKWADDPRDLLHKQLSALTQALDIDNDSLDPLWPYWIRNLHLANGKQLADILCKMFEAEPFRFETAQGEIPESGTNNPEWPDLYLVLPGPRYVGVIILDTNDQPVQWSGILTAIGRTDPQGRRLSATICLVNGPISEDAYHKHLSYNESLLIVTRESMAQLMVRAVENFASAYVYEVRSNPAERDLIETVRTLFEQPSRVLATVEDADKLLDESVGEDRRQGFFLVGRGLIGVTQSSSNPPVVETASKARYRESLRLAYERVDQFLQDRPSQVQVVAEVRECLEFVSKHPADAVSRSRVVLEAWLKNAYQKTIGDASSRSLDNVINDLRAQGIMPMVASTQAHSVRIMSNPQHHPGKAVRAATKVGTTWGLPNISSAEGLLVIDTLMYVAEWYVGWISSEKT